MGEITGYGQHCPISRALDVLGERCSLLIGRDMLVGTTRFNDLARAAGVVAQFADQAVASIRTAGIVERVGNEYLLNDSGLQLEPIGFGLGSCGARWTFGEPRRPQAVLDRHRERRAISAPQRTRLRGRRHDHLRAGIAVRGVAGAVVDQRRTAGGNGCTSAGDQRS